MPDNEPTLPESSQKAQDRLVTVMTHATAISFGLLTAFLYSMKDIPNDPTLEFSAGTVVFFIIGWLMGWLFWRAVRSLAEKASGRG